MPIAKKVHSYSSDTWINCAWFECDRQGYELYKIVTHEHVAMPCDDPRAEHIHFIFCTERHRQYFGHSHKNFGKLPPGYKLSI
jgi:hypothetical protein